MELAQLSNQRTPEIPAGARLPRSSHFDLESQAQVTGSNSTAPGLGRSLVVVPAHELRARSAPDTQSIGGVSFGCLATFVPIVTGVGVGVFCAASFALGSKICGVDADIEANTKQQVVAGAIFGGAAALPGAAYLTFITLDKALRALSTLVQFEDAIPSNSTTTPPNSTMTPSNSIREVERQTGSSRVELNQALQRPPVAAPDPAPMRIDEIVEKTLELAANCLGASVAVGFTVGSLTLAGEAVLSFAGSKILGENQVSGEVAPIGALGAVIMSTGASVTVLSVALACICMTRGGLQRLL